MVGRVCARDPWTCSPSQTAAMNAVNKPSRTVPQTLIVQTTLSLPWLLAYTICKHLSCTIEHKSKAGADGCVFRIEVIVVDGEDRAASCGIEIDSIVQRSEMGRTWKIAQVCSLLNRTDQDFSVAVWCGSGVDDKPGCYSR